MNGKRRPDAGTDALHAVEQKQPPTPRGRPRQGDGSWGRALQLADEDRLWRELLTHLPDNARLLWEALRDMRQFRRVLHVFGGQNLKIPQTPPGERTHRLCRKLGMRCLRKLVTAFGGTYLYVPRCDALMNQLRQHDIIEDFTRATRQGCSSTSAVSRLARRHGISDRRIWQILKKEGSAPAQARVLYRLGDSSRTLPVKMDNQL